jgi:type IV pilus assembly protein PilN
MLQINLLPVREARRKEDLRQAMMQGVLILLFAAAIVGLVHSRISDQLSSSNARIYQMQRDIDQFKPQLEQVAAFRKKKSQLEKKIGVIEDLDRARSGPVRVLSELATRIPDRLWLTTVRTEGKTILMAGQSLDNELVALFLRSLGESAYFADVDLDKTTMNSSKSGLKLVSFSIRANLVNPKAESAPVQGA